MSKDFFSGWQLSTTSNQLEANHTEASSYFALLVEEEEGLGESNDARTIGNARGPDNFAQLAIGRNTLTPVNGVGCCDEDSA